MSSNHLVHAGHGPSTSAFLSAFFTLVGTHGIHVTSGLVWMIVLMVQIKKYGLTLPNTRRLACLSLSGTSLTSFGSVYSA